MARMSIVSTNDELQEGDHLVLGEVYKKIALMILVESQTRDAELPLERNGGTCPRCAGMGKLQWIDEPPEDCSFCHGTGHI